jgi:peptide/nickel transport system permease protein
VIRAVVRRAAAAIPLLLVLAAVVFVLADAAPGSPIDRIVGDRPVPPEVRQRLEAAWGTDRPVLARCASWLSAAVGHGDLGWSFSRGTSVARVLESALPATLLLGAAALTVQLLSGLGLGVVSARRPNRALDRFFGSGTLVLYSVPTFWLGVMAILLFAVAFPIFPPSSTRSVGSEAWPLLPRLADRGWHVALPALVLGLGSAAGLARHVRAAMVRAGAEPFCRAARARGASRRRVLLGHAFREAIPPVLALTGISLPFLFSGSLVVEVVFGWPGLGRVTYEAVQAEDLPLVAAATLLSATAVVAANLLADIGLMAADPRLRAPGRGSR